MNVFVITLLFGGVIFAIGMTAAISSNRDIRRKAEEQKAQAAKL